VIDIVDDVLDKCPHMSLGRDTSIRPRSALSARRSGIIVKGSKKALIK
jgi:hypothetical protein